MKKYLCRFIFLRQFLKFSLVGISNTIISYVTYALLVYLGIYYLFASVISFAVSVLNSFYWNNKYVFKEDRENRTIWKTLFKTFLSYSLTGLLLSNILLFIWVDYLNINEYFAPIINLCITIPLNFILNKYWAYREK